MIPSPTPAEERHLLDSNFEPSGDGYVFYRHHWSRGVAVTAEEREVYLRPRFGASRRDFYKAIEGRPADLPRRSWWRSQRVTLASIPASIGLGLILTGALLAWRADDMPEPPLRWLLLVAGAMGIAYGLLILAVRLLGPPSRRL